MDIAEKNVIKSHFIAIFFKEQYHLALPWALGYLLLGSWSPRQCQVLDTSHGMGFRLN